LRAHGLDVQRDREITGLEAGRAEIADSNGNVRIAGSKGKRPAPVR